MSINDKYEPYGSKLVVLSHVDECVYWYTSNELGEWFVDKLNCKYTTVTYNGNTVKLKHVNHFKPFQGQQIYYSIQ